MELILFYSLQKALSKSELKKLLEYALRLGLEVLVEIHDKEDLIKAIFAGANIGINHRNLETFEMDMELTEKLMPLIPKMAKSLPQRADSKIKRRLFI